MCHPCVEDPSFESGIHMPREMAPSPHKSPAVLASWNHLENERGTKHLLVTAAVKAHTGNAALNLPGQRASPVEFRSPALLGSLSGTLTRAVCSGLCLTPTLQGCGIQAHPLDRRYFQELTAQSLQDSHSHHNRPPSSTCSKFKFKLFFSFSGVGDRAWGLK